MERRNQSNSPERKDGRSVGRLYPLSEALSRAVTKTPSKTRSLSDSAPTLSPSPKFKEPSRKASDDNTLLATPSRLAHALEFTTNGLTLQMPPRDSSHNNNTHATLGGYPAQIDTRNTYGSPSSVLPRHSRGLDFSRAATHLHHSTIAEQSSPESSPTITQKTLMQSSRRPSSHSMILDSPRMSSGWMWGGSMNMDRPFLPRSVGSTTAMISESSSSGSDDDNLMQEGNSEDPIIATPHVNKFDNVSASTPYGVPRGTGSASWLEGQSPISIPHAFTNIRHGRKPRDRGRHSSDSADSRSRRTTPDPQLSRESTMSNYFGRDSMSASRRESLSLGTNHLHITSSNEEADESGSSGTYGNPGVIRRPVTRRSNLLPKTKGFARIRAALQEESAPVDSETKREAEVVKQVHANYQDHDWSTSVTAPPSPDLTPTVPSMPRDSSSMSDIDGLGLDYGPKMDQRRGSTQKEFWSSMFNRMQTPPPQQGNRARSSSGMSDVGMDSPQVSTPASSSTTMGTTQTATAMPAPDSYAQSSGLPSLADVSRKVTKRRRDDDFDVHSIKRRAVSPGLSIQSSPVTTQSPITNSGSWWGQSKVTRESSIAGVATSDERPGSISAGPSNVGPKRVGLQGMTDTSDGLMKMSIE